jgi:hypothetical protein
MRCKLVLKTFYLIFDFPKMSSQDPLALKPRFVGSPCVAHGGKMIGQLLQRTRLFQCQWLCTPSSWQNQKAFRLSRSRDDHRSKSLAIRHPAGKRSHLWATYHQRIEDLAPQRGLGLLRCNPDHVERHAWSLGGYAHMEIACSIDGAHFERGQGP